MDKKPLHCPTLDNYVLFAALSLSALAALLMGQNRCYDIFNYHYYCGYALLHKKSFYDFVPAQLQSFFNPILHVPSYLMLRFLPSKVMAIILGCIQGLNFWLVYKISKDLFSRLEFRLREGLSLANAATAYYGAACVSEVGTTMGDNVVSIFQLAALLFTVRSLLGSNAPDRSGYLWLGVAGLLSGLAAGVKSTAAIYTAAMAISLLIICIMFKRPIRVIVSVYAGILLGFLVSYGYWGFSLYREYRNPLFPFLNNIFHSPYFDSANIIDPRFFPRNRLQSLFYPFYFAWRNTLTSEVPFRDVRLAACYVLVLVLGVFYCRGFLRRASAGIAGCLDAGQNRCLAFIAIFMTLSYIFWEKSFPIYRYVVVLELMAPVFLSLGVLSVVRRPRVFLSVVLLLNALICWHEIPLSFGRDSSVEHYLDVRVPDWDHLEDSVVLMVGIEASSFIIPSFPKTTRFVRIESTFAAPGKNDHLDEIIRIMLSRYDQKHTLVYLRHMEELKTAAPALLFTQTYIDTNSCAGIVSKMGNAGYLCRTLEPKLEVFPKVVQANIDSLTFTISNMRARAIDLLYTLDGKEMPPIIYWPLDSRQQIRIFVSDSTPKGLYHILGIRDSESPDKKRWARVDVEAVVR